MGGFAQSYKIRLAFDCGKELVGLLSRQGYQPFILSSRNNPAVPKGVKVLQADLTDSSRLAAVVGEPDIIIHCASNPRDSANVDVSRNLLAALAGKHSPHLIYLSIVGVDKSQYPYYRHKRQVENLVQASGLPWSILRANQFHDLVLHCIIHRSVQGVDLLHLTRGNF